MINQGGGKKSGGWEAQGTPLETASGIMTVSFSLFSPLFLSVFLSLSLSVSVSYFFKFPSSLCALFMLYIAVQEIL
jgi:hypothetical protein